MMSLPNVLLFSLAWTMVSNVFDAGQGIGVVQAMLILPIIAMVWPGPPGFLMTASALLLLSLRSRHPYHFSV